MPPSSHVAALEVPVLTSGCHHPHRTSHSSTAHSHSGRRAHIRLVTARAAHAVINIRYRFATTCSRTKSRTVCCVHPPSRPFWCSPSLPADSPLSLLPACCKNGHPSPCVAPLPVCCVPPTHTHVTPPRRAAFGSVACSAGGLRKERGYAWGVSGREGCREESTQCGGVQ
jgi:hypothetical protein